ncbi:MAG: RbsD/FucU domain-containing protein [Hungatella sp.]
MLHPELAKALATCGHTDIILVTDAGFPIPKDANRIDLGYYAGAVDVLGYSKDAPQGDFQRSGVATE